MNDMFFPSIKSMNLTMVDILQGLLDGTHLTYLIHLSDKVRRLANSKSIKEDEVISKEHLQIEAQNICFDEVVIKNIYVSLMI